MVCEGRGKRPRPHGCATRGKSKVSTLLFVSTRIGSAIDPGLKHLRETKMAYGRVLPGPLRCSDVPLYDSVVDSHAHGLSFPPTLVVVGALMLKRWIVQ